MSPDKLSLLVALAQRQGKAWSRIVPPTPAPTPQSNAPPTTPPTSPLLAYSSRINPAPRTRISTSRGIPSVSVVWAPVAGPTIPPPAPPPPPTARPQELLFDTWASSARVSGGSPQVAVVVAAALALSLAALTYSRQTDENGEPSDWMQWSSNAALPEKHQNLGVIETTSQDTTTLAEEYTHEVTPGTPASVESMTLEEPMDSMMQSAWEVVRENARLLAPDTLPWTFPTLLNQRNDFSNLFEMFGFHIDGRAFANGKGFEHDMIQAMSIVERMQQLLAAQENQENQVSIVPEERAEPQTKIASLRVTATTTAITETLEQQRLALEAFINKSINVALSFAARYLTLAPLISFAIPRELRTELSFLSQYLSFCLQAEMAFDLPLLFPEEVVLDDTGAVVAIVRPWYVPALRSAVRGLAQKVVSLQPRATTLLSKGRVPKWMASWLIPLATPEVSPHHSPTRPSAAVTTIREYGVPNIQQPEIASYQAQTEKTLRKVASSSSALSTISTRSISVVQATPQSPRRVQTPTPILAATKPVSQLIDSAVSLKDGETSDYVDSPVELFSERSEPAKILTIQRPESPRNYRTLQSEFRELSAPSTVPSPTVVAAPSFIASPPPSPPLAGPSPLAYTPISSPAPMLAISKPGVTAVPTQIVDDVSDDDDDVERDEEWEMFKIRGLGIPIEVLRLEYEALKMGHGEGFVSLEDAW
ncbi:hypothetical protein BJ742DRAFT_779621 [Cladochytrium replicatum]|nr:hypothetical protein BJ742DRAFT_779621 [Cladochytrium replicatum]